jgi:hypothetical protein
MLMATLIVWRRRFPAFQKQEMRLEMIFIECLFEWAGEFAGIIGVFIVLLLVGAGVFFVGTYVLLVPGVLIEEFIHDESFQLIPWRAALVIGVVTGLLLIRWYLPFAIAGAIGLIGMFFELIGTSG